MRRWRSPARPSSVSRQPASPRASTRPSRCRRSSRPARCGSTRRAVSGSTPIRSAASARADSAARACVTPWRSCRSGSSPASGSTRSEPMMEHMHPTNRLIGSPVPRIEDLRFLRGRGELVADVALDGMLHAAILRSSVGHGRIREVDPAAARALPGVHAVITAAEIGTVPRIPLRLDGLPDFEPYRQPVIAADKVRYAGEPIAVVLAESAALAEDALEAISVEIEPLPVVADRDAARAGERRLFDGVGNVPGTLVA